MHKKHRKLPISFFNHETVYVRIECRLSDGYDPSLVTLKTRRRHLEKRRSFEGVAVTMPEPRFLNQACMNNRFHSCIANIRIKARTSTKRIILGTRK